MKKKAKKVKNKQKLKFEVVRYATIKNSKGKVIERRKITSQQQYNTLRQNYKTRGSFHAHKVRFQLARVTETEDMRGLKAYKGKSGKYQYYVRGLAVRQEIIARSNMYSVDYPIQMAREEALTNFYSRVAQSYGKEYDKDIGKRIEERGGVTILNEGIVRYDGV